MILVSTGTNGKSFDRLLAAVARVEWHEELVVQRGPSTIEFPSARCVSSIPFDEFSELVRAARVVITHAGVGSILVSLMHRRIPIVVPRLASFAEAVDDHQLELARKLVAAGLAAVVTDVSTILTAVKDHRGEFEARTAQTGAGLAADIRAYLHSI